MGLFFACTLDFQLLQGTFGRPDLHCSTANTGTNPVTFTSFARTGHVLPQSPPLSCGLDAEAGNWWSLITVFVLFFLVHRNGSLFSCPCHKGEDERERLKVCKFHLTREGNVSLGKQGLLHPVYYADMCLASLLILMPAFSPYTWKFLF